MINFNTELLLVFFLFSIIHLSDYSTTSSDFPELIVIICSMNISDDVLETTRNLSFHPSNVVVADVSIDADRGPVASTDVFP